MANITGTAGNDTLEGTINDDRIIGLEGDDRIVGSIGIDTIDGGDGNDTADYSNATDAIRLILRDKFSDVYKYGDFGQDSIVNIETVVGNPNQSRNIINFVVDPFTSADIDLSENRVTYSAGSVGSKTITIKNFNIIIAGGGNSRLRGNDSDNIIASGSGKNTVIWSKGNDSLSTNYYDSTVDYSSIGRAVKLLADWSIVSNGTSGNILSPNLKIDKGNFGTDTIKDFKQIIGTTNKENTIDSSNTSDNGLSLDVNLATNSLKLINTSGYSSDSQNPQKHEILNFVNVIGTKNNDLVVGANKKGKLTGGGGNDSITGGNKNDIITGSDSTSRGVGEVDILTGGDGRDKFVLGDKNGAYYVANKGNDYALITDFNLFQDSIILPIGSANDLGNLKNYSFAAGGTNTIDLFSGKDVNTRDLIAKIQLTGLGGSGVTKGASSRMATMAGDSPMLATAGSNLVSSLAGQINILSGANSTADLVV